MVNRDSDHLLDTEGADAVLCEACRELPERLQSDSPIILPNGATIARGSFKAKKITFGTGSG